MNTVNTPKVEAFYWATITFSQTLGTALGDWMADDTGLGYIGAALVFGAALALVAAAYFWTKLSHVTLFWTAFILTRPLGATVGDYLDKPVDHGGLALSRPVASLVLGIAMLALILDSAAARRRASAELTTKLAQPSYQSCYQGYGGFAPPREVLRQVLGRSSLGCASSMDDTSSCDGAGEHSANVEMRGIRSTFAKPVRGPYLLGTWIGTALT